MPTSHGQRKPPATTSAARSGNHLPELEEQAERNLERNRDNLLQDLGVASQKELDELRGRIDRLEQQFRQINRAD